MPTWQRWYVIEGFGSRGRDGEAGDLCTGTLYLQRLRTATDDRHYDRHSAAGGGARTAATTTRPTTRSGATATTRTTRSRTTARPQNVAVTDADSAYLQYQHCYQRWYLQCFEHEPRCTTVVRLASDETVNRIEQSETRSQVEI